MLNAIKYCYENNKMTYFYFNSQELCGYIAHYNEKEILINHITPQGLYDGYIIRRISDIVEIDYDGKYDRKIEKLYKIRNQAHKTVDFKNDDIIYTMLDFAKENGYIVSLDFEDTCASGLLVNYKDNIVTINAVDRYGEKDGVNVIDINNVIAIFIDTDNEQKLRILMNN